MKTLILTLIFCLALPVVAAIRIPNANSLQPIPQNVRPNFSNNINSSSTSLTPAYDHSSNSTAVETDDATNTDTVAIDTSTTKNPYLNIWYWVIFVLIVLFSILLGLVRANRSN